MTWGLCKRTRSGALAAGLIISGVVLFGHAYAAHAADLNYGGNCCADLEERVANLEATTVTKSTKNVTVQIYGVMNRAEEYWNDGSESNVYNANNGYTNSRFGIIGQSKISPNWTTGYRFEIGMQDAISGSLNQHSDKGNNALHLRDSYWYITGKHFGTIDLGLASTVKDDINKKGNPVKGLNDTMTEDLEFVRGFYLRSKGMKGNSGLSSLTFGDIASCYSSSLAFDCSTRRSGVVYWTPKFAGFQLGADFAQDNTWAVGGHYRGHWGNFKVAADAAYEDMSDNTIGKDYSYYGQFASTSRHRIREAAGDASIMHVPTGLFVMSSWTHSQRSDSGTNLPDMDGYNVEGGIHRTWFKPGASTFFGGYTRVSNGLGGITTLDHNGKLWLDDGTIPGVNVSTNVTGSVMQHWYLGFDQGFDSSGLHLYLVYQHVDPSISLVDSHTGSKVASPLENFNVVYAGARLYF